ncbi:MAG: lytic transglycosylase domain-containing protein [Candidatus Baltobacteraceae bacterium]
MKNRRFARLGSLTFLLSLLYGCSQGGYLPYAPHSMDPSQLQSLVSEASATYDVPPALTSAVVMAESAGNPAAISSAGAEGLMQLMPGTAASHGVSDPFDPRENVFGGTAYLHDLLVRYNNNVQLAVAAYNAGPGAVDQYHGVPPYAETRAYVARVLAAYHSY